MRVELEWCDLEPLRLGRAVLWVGQKVKPRVSGEKRAEDVLPSWRSMQSLTVKKLPSDCGAGVSPQTAKPRHDGVPQECGCQEESNNTSVQKRGGGDAEICEIED
jgi:hypothetical protein